MKDYVYHNAGIQEEPHGDCEKIDGAYGQS
jgi:hypothetical protein